MKEDGWGLQEVGTGPSLFHNATAVIFVTAHTCGKFPCKSFCFAGNNTRRNKKMCQILTCSILVQPRIKVLALLDVNHVQVEENWAAYSRARSAKQCVHRKSGWTGPVTYTLQGHLWACGQRWGTALSPCPHCGQQQGAAGSLDGGCTGARAGHPPTEITLSDQGRGNLLLLLESMYVIVSYTICKN